MITCDYCDQPATHHLIDGNEVLCRACVAGQFDRPTEWVRPLTAAKISKIVTARTS